MTFTATAHGEGLKLTNETVRGSFKRFLKENQGIRIRLEPIMPESKNQRGFFEGAIVPLFCFYQEGMDYHNGDDLRKVRGWLKMEYNSEYALINGKAHKVEKSTRGELNRGFLLRVMDGMADNGYQVEVLNPEDFKKWKKDVRPHGGPDNYIDYLLDIGKLKNICLPQ